MHEQLDHLDDIIRLENKIVMLLGKLLHSFVCGCSGDCRLPIQILRQDYPGGQRNNEHFDGRQGHRHMTTAVLDSLTAKVGGRNRRMKDF